MVQSAKAKLGKKKEMSAYADSPEDKTALAVQVQRFLNAAQDPEWAVQILAHALEEEEGNVQSALEIAKVVLEENPTPGAES